MNVPNTSVEYVGEYSHRLDSRNRVTVPSNWRVPGDDGIFYFAWPHPEGCIAVFPPEMYEELREKARHIKQSDRQGQRTLRMIFGKGFRFGCDGQGRILLPAPLLKYAGVSKDVWLVGLSRSFEIWSGERFSPLVEDDYDYQSAMADLGI